jgi:hypothetical protein
MSQSPIAALKRCATQNHSLFSRGKVKGKNKVKGSGRGRPLYMGP